MFRHLQDFLSNVWAQLAIALILLVLGWKMSARGANLILLLAWLILGGCVFRLPGLISLPLIPRWLSTVGVSAAIGLAIYYTLWTSVSAISTPESANIKFFAHILSTPPAHPPDTILGGIVWEQHYTDLRLDIINGSTLVQNLNIKISLDNDHLIAAVAQLSNFPSVTIFPTQDSPHDGRPNPPRGLRAKTEQGTFPADPYKEVVCFTYRIHCDDVFPESTVRFVIAAPAELTSTEAPSTIHIVGSYESAGQNHAIDITHSISND
jgi:hypothetical protein